MAKTPKTSSKSADQPNDTAKKNPMMIPMMLGAVLIGVVLGMAFNGQNASSMTDEAFNRKVEAYIQENSGRIIEALNNHVRQQAQAEKQQAINLVKANDGKTVLGNPNGDVTIYEFSDYNCGYCKRAFNDVMGAIAEDGNIRLVIKEFPILAESSNMAAQLSMAAAELGKFEEIHTALMQWQGRLNEAALMQIVEEADMDMNALAEIITKGEIDKALAETRAIAEQMQISGTPGFIIGDQIVPGYIPKDEILALVKQAREG